MPYFQGSARQRGRGLGTMALSFGRSALPIFKKYILPTAKRLGQIALESAAPELLELAAGRTQPRAALKRVAQKTARSQLGNGPRKRKRRQKQAPVVRKKSKPSGGSRKKRVSRKKTKTKNSRFDILQNLNR